MERILLVCMGNICRSPMAEGIVRSLADRKGMSTVVRVDSAGTQASAHAKETPDPRACQVAKARGISLSGIYARQVTEADFSRFDRILAMDRQNLEYLRRNCPAEHYPKIGLFLDYASDAVTEEVPDPYYSNLRGFENVFDLCEGAARGLLDSIAASQGITLRESDRG